MKLFVLILFWSVSLFGAMPDWMYKLPTQGVNVYIGYGIGSTSQEAKANALNDVASQISVQIKSSLQIATNVKNGKVEKNSSDTVSQKSEAILNDYKLLRSEYKDGKYYIAISYENIPSLDKFVKKLKQTKPPKKVSKRGYLHHTLAAKELKKAFGDDIDFFLVRKDKKWFVGYDNILQVLDKRDFAKFFATVPNDELEISTNKKNNILYDGDKFYFKVRSTRKGFVSIVTVYEDGTVSTLIRNVPILANKTENIPDEEFETVPEAGLMKEGEETFDLYVAIYSDKKLHFDNFAYADEELIEEEKYKNFDQLLEFIDGKTYATLKVVTKPKKF